MGRYTRLGKNTALVFIGTAGSKLLSLLMLPFYTNWLTTADYGSVDLMGTYAGLALGVISCSIFDAIFIFPKDQPKCIQKQYFSSGLFFAITAIAISAIICLTITILSQKYQLNGFIYEYIWFIYGIMAINYIQTITQQFLRSIDKMVVYSTTGIVLTVSTIGFSFIFIPKSGVKGYVISILLANIISILFSIITGKIWRYISIHSIKRLSLIEMLTYSIPLIPNGIMWFLINALNRPVLEHWTGIASVGILAVASRFPNLLNTVYLLFQNAWLISVMEEAKKDAYTVFYNRMLQIVISVQIFLAAVLAFFGKWIIELFTTPEYYSASQYIPLLVIGVIFMNIATFVGSNFAVTRESKYYFYSTVWAGISSIIFNFALIPIWGLWGACWTMIFSQALCMIARIKYSWKTVKINNIAFYCHNIIFLTICVAASIFIESPLILYSIATIMLLYFYIINRHIANFIIQFIKIKYDFIHKHH